VRDAVQEVMAAHVRRAIDEATTPAAVADLVVRAVERNAVLGVPARRLPRARDTRWERIAEKLDPEPPENMPGLPPRSQIMAEVMAAMEAMAAGGNAPA
jgi:hypothetical protein